MNPKLMTPEEYRILRASLKADYDLYRQIAKDVATSLGIRVEDRGPVHIIEGGAFVEAQIFISEAKLAEAKARQQSDVNARDVFSGAADLQSIDVSLPDGSSVLLPREILEKDRD